MYQIYSVILYFEPEFHMMPVQDFRTIVVMYPIFNDLLLANLIDFQERTHQPLSEIRKH